MCAYLPDTNVLIDFGRDLAVRAKLENAQQDASEFVIAPPVLIELVRGVIARGRANFERERKVFAWLHAHHLTVLELPRPFMAQILQTSTRKRSGAVPRHYDQSDRHDSDVGRFRRIPEKNYTGWQCLEGNR